MLAHVINEWTSSGEGKKCPELVCVPPDFDLYVRFSGKMRRIYEQYSSRV